jgi:predicted DNA-binding protein (MmcQ/YjbR family)
VLLMMDVQLVQKEHFQQEEKSQHARIKLAQKIHILIKLEQQKQMIVLLVQPEKHLTEELQQSAQIQILPSN